jgi:hypothetical protein
MGRGVSTELESLQSFGTTLPRIGVLVKPKNVVDDFPHRPLLPRSSAFQGVMYFRADGDQKFGVVTNPLRLPALTKSFRLAAHLNVI